MYATTMSYEERVDLLDCEADIEYEQDMLDRVIREAKIELLRFWTYVGEGGNASEYYPIDMEELYRYLRSYTVEGDTRIEGVAFNVDGLIRQLERALDTIGYFE